LIEIACDTFLIEEGDKNTMKWAYVSIVLTILYFLLFNWSVLAFSVLYFSLVTICVSYFNDKTKLNKQAMQFAWVVVAFDILYVVFF
jgi:hypothetical protein